MADKLPASPGRAEIDAFLTKVAATPPVSRAGRGRLIFALDATASREGTWRQAQAIHADMFQSAALVGGLDIQLVFYRGMGECKAGPWTSDPDKLLGQLRRVACIGGETQIAKVLKHVAAETAKAKVHALVFVGDCMEENVDTLCRLAGELGLLGVPAFLFHEGRDEVAERAFRQIAKLSGGAACAFDASAPGQLRELLKAVAVFAAGGRKALADHARTAGGMALRLTTQLPSP
ncbi:VWA domain-containing protein [Magnetospirillum sp. UT-4]|uniref:VWA domain-containing protein n=1 Tax=Magnetospirillum sp. UT-4 TaxID=2681467 RepID=UPI0015747FB5|nr:VWA domain-containing protein [Magnetospirillum sp. UT-4]